METRTLYRSQSDKIIAGVCGGLGRYFDVDPVLVRIIFIILAITNGIGIIFYILMMVIVPKEPVAEAAAEKDGSDKTKEFAEGAKEKINAFAEEMRSGLEDSRDGWMDRRRNLVGLTIILVGLIALMSEIMPGLINWSLFWPTVLIMIGLLVIFKNKRYGRK